MLLILDAVQYSCRCQKGGCRPTSTMGSSIMSTHKAAHEYGKGCVRMMDALCGAVLFFAGCLFFTVFAVEK